MAFSKGRGLFHKNPPIRIKGRGRSHHQDAFNPPSEEVRMSNIFPDEDPKSSWSNLNPRFYTDSEMYSNPMDARRKSEGISHQKASFNARESNIFSDEDSNSPWLNLNPWLSSESEMYPSPRDARPKSSQRRAERNPHQKSVGTKTVFDVTYVKQASNFLAFAAEHLPPEDFEEFCKLFANLIRM